MLAFLVSQDGHSASLEARAVRVGSAAHADLPIHADFGLAPLHFEIVPVAHGRWIRRLNPDFPLLINGRRVDATLLQNGDVITAGLLSLTFRRGSPTGGNPSPGADASGTPAKSTLLFSPVSEPLQTAASLTVEEETTESEQEEDAQVRKKKLFDLFGPGADGKYPRFEMLKEAQNFGGALLTAFFALIFSVFIYSYLVQMSWFFFLQGIIALSFTIGWGIKAVGSGLEPRFGMLASLTSLLVVFLVNLLTYAGVVVAEVPASMATPSGSLLVSAPDGWSIFFGPKALIAMFGMSIISFFVAFRTLTKEEISELQKPL